MSDAHIFQLFGLAFFSIGVGMLANKKFVDSILEELEENTMTSFMGGLVSIIIGYFLVTFHNVWSGWPVIITIMGWIALFKGLAFLMAPSVTARFYKKIIGGKTYTSSIAWFPMILGILALYLGYLA